MQVFAPALKVSAEEFSEGLSRAVPIERGKTRAASLSKYYSRRRLATDDDKASDSRSEARLKECTNLGREMEVVYRSKPTYDQPRDELLTLTKPNLAVAGSAKAAAISSEDDVLKILEAQPTIEDLSQCLRWLLVHRGPYGSFNITLPGPRAAGIVNLLVTQIAANFWDLMSSDSDYEDHVQDLLSCLRSVPGIGALLLRIGALSSQIKQGKGKHNPEETRTSSNIPVLSATRDILARVLRGDNTINCILDTVFGFEGDARQQQILWNQAIAQFAGGKILSTLVQADLVLADVGSLKDDASLGNGTAYATWLGQNIQRADETNIPNIEKRSTARATLFGRALSLGYSQQLIESLFNPSLLGDEVGAERNFQFLRTLKLHEQRLVVYNTLLVTSTPNYQGMRTNCIQGLAALLRKWCHNQMGESGPLVEWIVGVDRGRTSASITAHRSVVAALAEIQDSLTDICERLIKSFGDPIYMQNASIAEQETQIQDLLLIVGCISRQDISLVKQLSKSSDYINAISNRLASSASRPRLLGMFVAVAISELVDGEKAQLRFEETLSNQGEMDHHRSLLTLNDRVGRVSDLQPSISNKINVTDKVRSGQTLAAASLLPLGSRRNQRRESTSSKSEDDDDPTLVNRKKPIRPVYIRDLLRGLGDVENREQYRLCLTEAAMLIRRKATFGSEVTDHLEELATALAGARETFEEKHLAEAQLQGMIAALIASPAKMGRWFSLSVFAGDYSVSQRTSILTSIVFAARELAGYRKEDSSSLSLSDISQDQTKANDMFPSKRLPPSLAAFSGTQPAGSKAIDDVTSKLERNLIRPIAASAADQVTGPNVLKVRTFSSRLKTDRSRNNTISNELSKIVADCMFFPLTDRFRLEVESRGSSSPFTLPFLSAHFLKTLGLLMAAAGPNTLSFQEMTAELLALCISPRIRSGAIKHLPIMESLLFCLLVLLEVNSSSEKTIVLQHGTDMLEVKTWVEAALDKISPGDRETLRVRTLGAGVLVHCTELISRYQEQMMGMVAEFL